MTVAKSPRMAQTLSMASLDSGIRGPQSASLAYLNPAARKKATKAGALPASPTRKPKTASSKKTDGSSGKVSYRTKDGRTVRGTKGQVARWRKQRKN